MHPLLFFLFITHVISIPVGSKEGIPIGTLNTTAPDSDPFGLPLTSHGFWTPLSGHNVVSVRLISNRTCHVTFIAQANDPA